MKKFWIVLKKEVIDCFRDKRSMVMMLLPLLFFPLLLTFYNYQIESADKNISKKIVLSTNNEEEIVDFIDMLNVSGLNVEVISVDDPIQELKKGNISFIVNNVGNSYSLIYDQNSIQSTKAISVVSAIIESNKMAMVYEIFNYYGESIEILSQYNYTLEDVSISGNKSEANSLITILGPMMIVMFIATGGTGMALDIFCGEKERGSLEGILSTQINRKSLYLAKVITVFLFVCFSSLISVGGYLISFLINNQIATSGLGFSTQQIILFFIVVGVFAFFTATVISMLSLSAKTVKEGSLRINLFTLIPTIVGGISMYIEIGKIPLVTNFIPITNVINMLKAIFVDTISYTQLLITLFSTIMYGIIFLVGGYCLINSEKILDK